MSRLTICLAIALLAGCAASDAPTTPRASRTGAPARESPGDPTRGQFINATSWSLRVWVDAPVNDDRSPTVILQAGESVPWVLRPGEHRIVAQAYAAGQPSGPVLARFDRTIALDPKRPEGWFLRFREADFR